MANTSVLQQLTNRPILLKVEAINIQGKKCLEVVSFRAKNIAAMPSSVAFLKVCLLPRQDPLVHKAALSFSACPRHTTHKKKIRFRVFDLFLAIREYVLVTYITFN